MGLQGPIIREDEEKACDLWITLDGLFMKGEEVISSADTARKLTCVRLDVLFPRIKATLHSRTVSVEASEETRCTADVSVFVPRRPSLWLVPRDSQHYALCERD